MEKKIVSNFERFNRTGTINVNKSNKIYNNKCAERAPRKYFTVRAGCKKVKTF